MRGAQMTEIQEKIMNLLKSPAAENRIYTALRDDHEKPDIEDALLSLIDDGYILQIKNGRYATTERIGYRRGIYRASSAGYGFISDLDDGKKADLFVPPGAQSDAWNSDEVLFREFPSSRGEGRSEARVFKVYMRKNRHIRGQFVKYGAHFYVLPESRFLPHRIGIMKGRTARARNGDLVSVEMLTYGGGKVPALGRVEQIFGEDGSLKSAVAARLFEYDIKEAFPEKVLSSANNLPNNPKKEDYQGRLDLRGKLTFTIDGDNAKDFDDAVSLEQNERGNRVLGVHIADVSHYVRPGSIIDIEAYLRGTSVYFADRVVSMLPEALSNGLCSLVPNEDRLCFSVFLEIDGQCRILSSDFSKSVIRSKERMTYNTVNRLLSPDADPAISERYQDLLSVLRRMQTLAHEIRDLRQKRGALDFDLSEGEVVCNELGEPVDVRLRVRGEGERMIEDFMIAANEAVAEYMFSKKAPCVYRVHEKPDPDKLLDFLRMASLFGYTIKAPSDVSPSSLQKILETVRGGEYGSILSSALLRCLTKAKYLEQCTGHFGLASKYYLHFTSPIRRYPDLMVHRMLEQALSHGFSDENKIKQAELKCSETAFSSSEREYAAERAEREIEKLYKASYMKRHIGEVFPAVISGVSPSGFFVELSNTIEGMVLRDTLGERFVFDSEKQCLRAEGGDKVYHAGQRVTVTCTRTDETSGEIDFALSDVSEIS